VNTERDFDVVRQGSLDGLCGVYSIVNYFSRRADLEGEKGRSLSRRLLKTALHAIDNERQLNPHNLMAGFWQGQLRKAAEAITGTHDKKVEVETLAAFARKSDVSDPSDLIKSLKGRGAAILNMRDPGHWVLAYATPSGALRYDDPASGEAHGLGAAVIAERSVTLKKGLVFLHA
jgi:hypothetical protein